MAKILTPKSVETLTHGDATRRNIPTAEYQSIASFCRLRAARATSV